MCGIELVARKASSALIFDRGRVQGSYCEKVVLYHEAIVFKGLKWLPETLLVGARHLLAQLGDRLEQAKTQETLLRVYIYQIVTS